MTWLMVITARRLVSSVGRRAMMASGERTPFDCPIRPPQARNRRTAALPSGAISAVRPFSHLQCKQLPSDGLTL